MKKAISLRWIILLIMLVVGVSGILGYSYVSGDFSKWLGMTSEQASQILPVPHDIRLQGKSHKEGILLKWKVKKVLSGDYYDVYRRMPGLEGGWGEMIGRIGLDSSESLQFIDKNVEVGHGYIYQIVLIKVSNGYEVKEQASNSVEITYK